jgi:hypothetical protein
MVRQAISDDVWRKPAAGAVTLTRLEATSGWVQPAHFTGECALS